MLPKIEKTIQLTVLLLTVMPNNPREKFSLKDHLFHEKNIRELSERISGVVPDFDREGFIEAILMVLPSLELKARIDHIAHQFDRFIEGDYEMKLDLLLQSLRDELDPDRDDDDFGDFIDAPYSAFVALYGREERHLEKSLEALREITKRFSAEFAIRHFFRAYPHRVLSECIEWSKSPNYHIRRLASEGSRPSLPWGAKIPYTLGMTDTLLERLYRDQTTYVRRSVANHLHDITKINPGHVFGLLKAWKKEHTNPLHFEKLARHSLRTLIKSGHREALEWIGVSGEIRTVQLDHIDDHYAYGDTLIGRLSLSMKNPGTVRIDYRIGYAGKGGKLRYKIYSLHEGMIQDTLEKTIKIPLIDRSTRVLESGRHTIEVLVNGDGWVEESFELVK